MSKFDELVDRVKSQIREVQPDVVKARQERGASFTLIDVRERDEFVEGHLPNAMFIPRGLLDLRIEETVANRDQPIVLYCAAGTRSALAARTLHELGYANVESMAGGFTAWKQRGYRFEIPRALTPEQVSRYSRHLLVPEVGEAGQHKLLDARVLVLGAGGLGSPAALYLAAAGVGTLGIVDDDVVDRSNLQRQVLHTDKRVGTPKVESAEETISALNPDVVVAKHQVRLTSENVLEIFDGYDVVVDGGDNFPTRYLLNDACVHLGIPNVHGSVYRFEGQVTTFIAGNGPCYRCLYPQPPPPAFAPSCQEAGVLGVIPGIVGLLQALEVVKLLLQIGTPLNGRLLTFDGLRTEFRELRLRRDRACPTCGDDAKFEGFADYDELCGVKS